MATLYPVVLSEAERADLLALIHRGTTSARIVTCAHILLQADAGWRDHQIITAFHVSRETVTRVRVRFLAGGVAGVLTDKRQARRRHALSEAQATHLIALACTAAPEGHDHWTLRLLANQAVALGFVASISPETIRSLLKKNALQPWREQEWCIPTLSAEYVYRMGDVLDQYAQPDDDPTCPLVCLDEKPVTLHAEVTAPLPVAPGHPARHDYARHDYAYERRGTANLFVLVAPQRGWRHVAVTDRRTSADYAEQLRYLAEEAFPGATRIRLVQDNVNTHTLAALYAAFPPERAHALARRFDVHPTPKHASWLNMAEIEISVVSRSGLRQPVDAPETLARRVAALEAERNAAHATIDWRFSVLDARTKLHTLYPVPLTNLD